MLVVAPASVKYQWESGNPQVHRPAGAGHRRQHRGAAGPVRAADVLPPHQLRAGAARPRQPQRLAAGPDRPRRGAAHQELGVEDVAGRQEAAQPLRPRADRHAAGEQARGAVLHRRSSSTTAGSARRSSSCTTTASSTRRASCSATATWTAIREKLAPIFLRRTRAEVLGQLPDRTDSTVFVEMTDGAAGPYAEQQRRWRGCWPRSI